MKIEKYALLDTDFISKTHFIHGDTEKCLVDLVVEMPGYCFFCHSQIIKELSRHNQQAIGWLQHKISEQKIQCYAPKKPRRIGGRWSVLDRLHIKQAERRQKDNAPQQEQEGSRKN